MQRFIKLKSTDNYSLTKGMEGCIVRLKDMIGTLAVVHAPDLGVYCKPEFKFLAEPFMSIGSSNDYLFNEEHYQEVQNPFAHWNKIKGAQCAN